MGCFCFVNGFVEIFMDGWILIVDCFIGIQEVFGVIEIGQLKLIDVIKQVFVVFGDYMVECIFVQILSMCIF